MKIFSLNSNNLNNLVFVEVGRVKVSDYLYLQVPQRGDDLWIKVKTSLHLSFDKFFLMLVDILFNQPPTWRNILIFSMYSFDVVCCKYEALQFIFPFYFKKCFYLKIKLGYWNERGVCVRRKGFLFIHIFSKNQFIFIFYFKFFDFLMQECF